MTPWVHFQGVIQQPVDGRFCAAGIAWDAQAVANMVKMVGAKPVYCDCAEGSVNPGVAELKQKATPRTKAVIVCHTYGDLAAVLNILTPMVLLAMRIS